MAKHLDIQVEESIQDLVKLQAEHSSKFNRVQMLILIKKGLRSKAALADNLGCSSKSVHTWRNKYIAGGISLLLADGRTQKHEKISENIYKELSSYIATQNKRSCLEVQEWLLKEHNVNVDYDTLRKYLLRKFGPTRNSPRKKK